MTGVLKKGDIWTQACIQGKGHVSMKTATHKPRGEAGMDPSLRRTQPHQHLDFILGACRTVKQ